MKAKALLLLSLLILLLSATAAAQKASAPKNDASPPKPTGPKYDLSTEATVKGVIEEIKEVPNSCMGETGVHLVLKTDSGPVEVQIAPAAFLKEMEIGFEKGERLQVVGSKVTKDGATLLLARSIARNNAELVVRDKQGEPLWTWMRKGTGTASGK